MNEANNYENKKILLNQSQKKAIECGFHPVLVVAGAGTGKTFVLTQRIINLILNYGFDSDSILAFTFTNKAANEIKSRIARLVPKLNFKWIGTFHSICLKILIEDCHIINRAKNFLIIDEADQLTIIKNIYELNNFSKDDISYKKILSIISFLKSNQISYDDYDNIAYYYKDITFGDKKINLIQDVYQKYTDYLLEKNLFDFDDLIISVNKIFSISEQTKLKWSKRFSYIFVDEFQDTNYEQFQLIKYLAYDCKSIFVVGDPDQMIYSWRGSYENIFSDFKKYFFNYEIMILDQNYRSTKKILDISNQLIQNNINRIEKKLFTNNEDGNDIIFNFLPSQDSEANWIANKIIFLTHGLKKNYQDIVILYRSNYQSRAIEQSLIMKNIPYIIYGGLKFFMRKEIKDLIAYLKLIFFNDEVSLSRIYNFPRRKISDSTYSRIMQYSNQYKIHPFEVFKIADQLDITTISKKACIEFYDLIQDIKKEKWNDFAALINRILIDTKYFNFINQPEEQNRLENVKEFINYLIEFQSNKPFATIQDFLQEVSLYLENSETEQKNENSVKLMSIHNSKGLEFDNVFLCGLNDGIFPSMKSIDLNNIEEERRLAYVAMTRAKKNLFLTAFQGTNYHSKNFLQYKQSRFIDEIINNKNLENISGSAFKVNSDLDLEWYNSKIKENFEDKFHDQEIDFDINNKIVHLDFGTGIIVEKSQKTITVIFPHPYGRKTIIKNHKAIKRVIENN